MKKLLLALPLLLVAGCMKPGFTMPDRTKLVCAVEPPRPVGLGPDNAVTDEENGKYLRQLREAGANCRSQLKWVQDYLNNLKK